MTRASADSKRKQARDVPSIYDYFRVHQWYQGDNPIDFYESDFVKGGKKVDILGVVNQVGFLYRPHLEEQDSAEEALNKLRRDRTDFQFRVRTDEIVDFACRIVTQNRGEGLAMAIPGVVIKCRNLDINFVRYLAQHTPQKERGVFFYHALHRVQESATEFRKDNPYGNDHLALINVLAGCCNGETVLRYVFHDCLRNCQPYNRAAIVERSLVVLEVILSHLLHRAFAHYSEFYPEQRITYPCSVQPVKDAVRGMQIAWYEGSSHPIPENRRADIFAAVTANLNLAAEFDLTMEQLFRAKLLRLGGRTLAEEDKIGQTRAIEAAVNFLGTETGILPRPVTQLVAQYVDVPRAFDPNLNDERRLAIYRMCQPDFSDPRFISPAFRAVYFDLKKIENEIAEERAKEEAKRLREIEEQKARERKLAEDGAKKPEASELVETRFHSEDETTVAMPNPDPAPQSGGQVAQKSKGGEGRGGVDQKD